MTLQRVFLDWSQPLLPAVANRLIEQYAEGPELDLSNVMLVVTGRRAGRRLLELLVEKTADQWPGMRPPDIQTFSRFPESLYLQKRDLADELTQLLVWRRALSQVPQHEIRDAFPNLPGDRAFATWFALAEMLMQQHRELAADGLEFNDVYEHEAAQAAHFETDRWIALRRIQAEYLTQMDELGLWDRQAARLIAVQQNECNTDKDIWLIGTVDMARVVRQMLMQVAGRVTIVVHAPESEASAFDELGCLQEDEWLERPLSLTMEHVCIVNDYDDQADAVVMELAKQNGRLRPDEICLGVADEVLVPVIRQRLSQAGVTPRWAVGVTLPQTRPYRLLEAVSEFVGSASIDRPPSFNAFAGLIRHPDVFQRITESLTRTVSTESGRGRNDWLSEIDEFSQRSLPSFASTEHFARLCGDQSIVTRVAAYVDTLLAVSTASKGTSARPWLPLMKPRPVTQWLHEISNLLNAVYADREARPVRDADRATLEFLEQYQQFTEQLRRLPDGLIATATFPQTIQLVLRQLQDETLPPEPELHALEMLGWLDVTMDDSPVAIIAGFNEGRIPTSVGSDMFLPASFRSVLGLNDNRRRYVRDAYALEVLLHSRDHVALIAGRQDDQGSPLLPSRLMFATETGHIPDRIRAFFQGVQRESTDDALPAADSDSATRTIEPTTQFIVPAPTVADTADAIRRRRERDEKRRATGDTGETDDARIAVHDNLPQLTVTSFRTWLRCPYRYYLKHVLRLKSLDDRQKEMDGGHFGSVLHNVLDAFGGDPLIRDSTSAEKIIEFLLSKLHAESRKRFGDLQNAAVRIQLRMMEHRLTAFANWQAAERGRGWVIVACEQDATAQFLDADERPLLLKGRIDRIDRQEQTGACRVVDYKTGESGEDPRAAHYKPRSQRWVDLQLPLYRYLLEDPALQQLELGENITTGYVILPSATEDTGFLPANWSSAELADADRFARETASGMMDLSIDRVAAGDPPYDEELARVCQENVVDRRIPWLPFRLPSPDVLVGSLK